MAAGIGEAGGEAICLGLDVTSETQWQQAIAATVARFGKLDILVNNAGIGGQSTIEDATEEMWDRVMDVNAKGVFLGTKAAIPEMRKVGGGSIVNISSIAGLVGSPYSSAYNASKGAVRLLTKSTAIQYAKEGIRAKSVHPGVSETEMTREVVNDEAFRQFRLVTNPIPRLGQPEDVAYGVLFLASDESSFMTGSELVIDGGWTAQ